MFTPSIIKFIFNWILVFYSYCYFKQNTRSRYRDFTPYSTARQVLLLRTAADMLIMC